MDPSYTPPSLDLNDRTVGLLIEAPQEEARPRVAYRYIDPGATAGLASLAPGATWSVKLNGVQPLSTLFVNWAFSFGAGEAPDLEIRVLDSEGDEVADSIEPEVRAPPPPSLHGWTQAIPSPSCSRMRTTIAQSYPGGLASKEGSIARGCSSSPLGKSTS